jgi:chorismate dehydratase
MAIREFNSMSLGWCRSDFYYCPCGLSFAAKFNTKVLDRKIRVGAVSYLNTKPLLYGIQHSGLMHEIDLTIDYPSRIAAMLLEDQIDIGLVPVAVIPRMRQYHINTGFCIGCDGPVVSVCIFSESPIEEVERVLLDYQSETSVHLAKLLLRDYWKISPEFIDAKEEFTDRIKGKTAALVIGDRALAQRKISRYLYDLGDAWKQHTGLPFIFAAWISNKKLDPAFVRQFNEANRAGLDNISVLIDEMPSELFDLQAYYTKYIRYELDERKMLGLEKFLHLIESLK